MSRRKKKGKTAAESVTKQQSIERRMEYSRKVEARGEVLTRNAAPLAADLRAAGFDVEDAWDLFNRKEPWRKDIPIPAYPEAIPILMAHQSRWSLETPGQAGRTQCGRRGRSGPGRFPLGLCNADAFADAPLVGC